MVPKGKDKGTYLWTRKMTTAKANLLWEGVVQWLAGKGKHNGEGEVVSKGKGKHKSKGKDVSKGKGKHKGEGKDASKGKDKDADTLLPPPLLMLPTPFRSRGFPDDPAPTCRSTGFSCSGWLGC